MFTPDIAQPPSPQQLWSFHAARRALDDALESLDAARMALLPLIEETQWQAKGVRALNVTLDEFVGRCGTIAQAVYARLWELEAAR